MIRINLLPHRAEKRKRRQVQFFSLLVVSMVVGGVLVVAGYGVIQAREVFQDKRNEYLKSEITKLDKQIEDIKRLREQTKALMDRKDEVEKLQSTRSDVVHLLDQILRILPEGVSLRSLKQKGNEIAITGSAQSNARVSSLMRAIEASAFLNSPKLIEIHASSTAKEHTNEFSMTFSLTKQTAPPKPPAPAAGGAASAPAAAPVAASAPAGTSVPVTASAPAASSAPAATPARK